jgi:DNA-binding IscR family transcriptional regulator
MVDGSDDGECASASSKWNINITEESRTRQIWRELENAWRKIWRENVLEQLNTAADDNDTIQLQPAT